MSVVVDEHASVPRKRWRIWVAIGIAWAVVAGITIWLIVAGDDADEDDVDYDPGPVALAFVSGFRDDGMTLDLSGGELRCIDEAGADVDPESVDSGFDMESGNLDPELVDFAAQVIDDCLTRRSRVGLFAQLYAADPERGLDAEQAQCMAALVDDAVQDGGGWSEMMKDPEAMFEVLLEPIAQLATECGILST